MERKLKKQKIFYQNNVIKLTVQNKDLIKINITGFCLDKRKKQFKHEEILMENFYKEHIVFLAVKAQRSPKYIYSVRFTQNT